MTVESILSVEFIYCECGCQRTRPRYDKKGREYRFISGHQFKPYKRELHYNWKEGKRKSGQYIRILYPEHKFTDSMGYVLEHRLVYEEYYKCCLLPWTVIHHKNIHNLSKEENKRDNSIENLEALIDSDHSSIHRLQELAERRKEIMKRICSVCGSNKTPFNKHDKYYMWYINPKDPTKWLCNACYIKYKRGSIKL